jgi:ABC-2 type transport system permease protein
VAVSAALAAGSLAKRELVRFFRQRSRVIGVLATPLVFWLLIGSGFNEMTYMFPGTLVQLVLFASIFSTISLIQDRNDGFLQGVLVSPAPRAAIVLGKVLGGMGIALLQGLLFLCLGPFVGVWPGPLGILAAVGGLALVSFALTSLGVALAWRFTSVQGFHGVMNLLLIPMWLLSGAVFRPDKALGWVRGVVTFNPLTYGVDLVRTALTGEGRATPLALGVTVGFGLLMFALATRSARGKMETA